MIDNIYIYVRFLGKLNKTFNNNTQAIVIGVSPPMFLSVSCSIFD